MSTGRHGNRDLQRNVARSPPSTVCTNSKRNQEDSSVYIHPSQSSDNSTSAKQKLTSDENVGQQGEEDKDPVSAGSVSVVDDLQVGVGVRGVHLCFAGQD
jgi:hypothetical protein